MRTSMISVMPGMGSGTKDESTMATRKRPKMPRLRKRWKRGECRGRGARSAKALWEMELATTAVGTVVVIPDRTLGHGRKSRSSKKKRYLVRNFIRWSGGRMRDSAA